MEKKKLWRLYQICRLFYKRQTIKMEITFMIISFIPHDAEQTKYFISIKHLLYSHICPLS